MNGEASVKVPEGKLVHVKTAYGERFTEVKIRGDFFIEPPEALHLIEDRIKGMRADSKKELIEDSIREIEATLIGFSASDIAEAVKESVEDSK